MTTSPAQPVATTPTDELRLRFEVQDRMPTGGVDGAWWPRSRDFQREAADLVDHFPPSGRIARLLFSRPDWDAAPGRPSVRHVLTARGPVKVGSFPRDDTHVMSVKMLTGQLIELLVIPPETSPARADRLMRWASDQKDFRTANELLAAEDPAEGLGRDLWDSEGGMAAP
ncbi:DUF5994 family protein [Nocardioides sambongensis]|uniref:DUF5994 family protein n=1 Tax=Nocardioides sambongensis TaxID=2589074 RepID=UPI00112BAB83|nr:DUF5994 family protein [Nocardioides sambongensis]